jgi:sugar/nucleoside kinase (ribokinase family)
MSELRELLPPVVRDVEAEDIARMKTQPLFAAERKVEIEAIVAGHICLDIIPTLVGKTLAFVPGRIIEADRAVFATGGAVSNTGLALHTLGVNTRLMGKVGNDLFGQAVFQILEAHGPELVGGMVVATGEASSYSVILSPPGVDRIIIHAPGCNNTFSANDVRYPILEQARLFHFGYPPLMARMYGDGGAGLVELFQRAKLRGVTASLDLSLPDPNTAAGQADWTAILTATLPFVDLFLPSIEELLFMLRRSLFEELHTEGSDALIEHVSPALVSELGQQLLAMGAKVVGIKLGQRGLYLRTAGEYSLMEMGRAQPAHLEGWASRELWAPCFATQVVGTTGSGDATIAGLLLGLLRGMTPEAALTAACAVGACSVEAADAVSGIQSWPATLTRIAAGWPRLRTMSTVQMSAAGWSWNEADELWVGPEDQQS